MSTVFSPISAGPQISNVPLGIQRLPLIFRFFGYIRFINSEKLCFILISKEKMARF